MSWEQNYDPLHGSLSTIVAALPLVTLLGLLALRRVPAYMAALAGLAVALSVAIGVIGMPAPMAARAALLGGAYGLLPIGWIVLNVMFLYRITSERGVFVALQQAITGLTTDRRLQLLLVAFCFGAFFEGAAGFGTPVAVTGAILIGIGFPPLEASALSLIANTAPVAFGSLGTPLVTLQAVTGLDLGQLSAMVGRQLPLFSLIVPFWLIVAYSGWRGMLEVWPAVLIAGLGFAIPQFLISNFHGPWLVDIVSAACSMAALGVYLRLSHGLIRTDREKPGPASHGRTRTDTEKPGTASHGLTRTDTETPGLANVKTATASRVATTTTFEPTTGFETTTTATRATTATTGTPAKTRTTATPSLRVALLPWVVLTIVVFLWGMPQVKGYLNHLSAPAIAVPSLDKLVFRMPPVVSKPTAEGAVFLFNWLSATGTAILIAALITGAALRYSAGELVRHYASTIRIVWRSLLTIVAMLALGYTSRYSGEDAILGLAFAQTGVIYPFFAALLGWLGVAVTGSDTSSNVLFGSLQTITANRLGLNPVLMAATNSSGGVMGKMIDAQSICVASAATGWVGHEWRILRYVFFHSLALASLVGILTLLQQYVHPFTAMIVR